MMMVSLTNQLGYNPSFPLSTLPTAFRLICGLEKSETQTVAAKASG